MSNELDGKLLNYLLKLNTERDNRSGIDTRSIQSQKFFNKKQGEYYLALGFSNCCSDAKGTRQNELCKIENYRKTYFYPQKLFPGTYPQLTVFLVTRGDTLQV